MDVDATLRLANAAHPRHGLLVVGIAEIQRIVHADAACCERESHTGGLQLADKHLYIGICLKSLDLFGAILHIAFDQRVADVFLVEHPGDCIDLRHESGKHNDLFAFLHAAVDYILQRIELCLGDLLRIITIVIADETACDLGEAEQLRQGVESTVFNFGGQTSNVATYREISVSGLPDGGDLRLGNAGASAVDSTRVTQLHFLPLEDYNAATGQSLTLNDGQVYVAALRTDFPYDTLTVDGEWTFRIMDRDIPPLSGPFTADITPTLMVVMPHFTQFVQELEDGLSEKYGWYLTATWHYAFDTDLPENQQGNIDGTTPNLEDALNGYLAGVSSDWGVGVSVASKAANRADFYGMYGGLFFLGIMLSIVFIFAAVAILYYKQLSEGYEDQSRFDIMQKVGMTKVDIRRSINSQLLTVFYLPLVLAGVHLCFAFPFIHKLLILFNLDNRGLLIGTTAVSFAVFAVLYAIVYKLTGNTYYRIVAEDTEKE